MKQTPLLGEQGKQLLRDSVAGRRFELVVGGRAPPQVVEYGSLQVHQVRIAKLEDSNMLVRMEAVRTLSKLEPAALAQYEQVLAKAAEEDEDSDVRRAVAEVLAKLQAVW